MLQLVCLVDLTECGHEILCILTSCMWWKLNCFLKKSGTVSDDNLGQYCQCFHNDLCCNGICQAIPTVFFPFSLQINVEIILLFANLLSHTLGHC